MVLILWWLLILEWHVMWSYKECHHCIYENKCFQTFFSWYEWNMHCCVRDMVLRDYTQIVTSGKNPYISGGPCDLRPLHLRIPWSINWPCSHRDIRKIISFGIQISRSILRLPLIYGCFFLAEEVVFKCRDHTVLYTLYSVLTICQGMFACNMPGMMEKATHLENFSKLQAT